MTTELVIPAYRRFCRENGLNFHFDELPAATRNARMALKEAALHREAHPLFNELQPEFHVWRDYIIKFRFWSWEGDVFYEAQSIGEFWREHTRLKKSEMRHETVVAALLIIAQVFLIVSCGLLARHVVPGLFTEWSSLLVFPGFLIAGSAVIWWFCHRQPARKREREVEGLRRRLEALRVRLNEVQVRPGSIRDDIKPRTREVVVNGLFKPDRQR